MRRRLGTILLDNRLISKGDLDKALATQEHTGGRLGEILVEQGVPQCCIDQALVNQLIEANVRGDEARA